MGAGRVFCHSRTTHFKGKVLTLLAFLRQKWSEIRLQMSKTSFKTNPLARPLWNSNRTVTGFFFFLALGITCTIFYFVIYFIFQWEKVNINFCLLRNHNFSDGSFSKQRYLFSLYLFPNKEILLGYIKQHPQEQIQRQITVKNTYI